MRPRHPLQPPSVSEPQARVARELAAHHPRVRAAFAASHERACSGELPAAGTATMSRELWRAELADLRSRGARDGQGTRRGVPRSAREPSARTGLFGPCGVPAISDKWSTARCVEDLARELGLRCRRWSQRWTGPESPGDRVGNACAITCGQAQGSAGVTPACGAPPRFVPGVTGTQRERGALFRERLPSPCDDAGLLSAGPIPDTPASQIELLSPSAFKTVWRRAPHGNSRTPGWGRRAPSSDPPAGMEDKPTRL